MRLVRVRAFHEDDYAFVTALGDETGRSDFIRPLEHAEPGASRLLLVAECEGAPFGVLSLGEDGAFDATFAPNATEGNAAEALMGLCRSAAQRGYARLTARARADLEPLLRRAGFRLDDGRDRRRILTLDLHAEIPHNRLSFGDAEVHAAAEAVRSGHWAQGPRVAALEKALSAASGVDHAVCAASGLGALRLALHALGVGPGDAVVLPAYSCVALANAILACGAEPVPVDIRRGDWNLDPARVREVAAQRCVKAVIAVNTFGAPADVEALGEVAQAPVIEDCAHGFALTPDVARWTVRADLAVCSFYATKLVGAGEGGAVLARTPEAAAFVTRWRDYSNQEPESTRLNDKMTDIEAAIALSQLERLPGFIATRSRLAARYARLLEPAAQAGRLLLPENKSQRVWYRYAVELLDVDAATLSTALAQDGTHAVRPVVDWRGGADDASPVADLAYRKLLSLPLYPSLGLWEQTRAAEALLCALGLPRPDVELNESF